VNGAGFFSNPTIYPWLAAPAVMAVIFILAARRGRKSRAAAGAAPSATATLVPTPMSTPMPIRPAATMPRAARRAPGSPGPAPPASGDDFAQVYLYLIAALDQGLERGEFSEESHALIRGNLKRRLETILADEPRAGIR
jgi:hypothetical protein